MILKTHRKDINIMDKLNQSTKMLPKILTSGEETWLSVYIIIILKQKSKSKWAMIV